MKFCEQTNQKEFEKLIQPIPNSYSIITPKRYPLMNLKIPDKTNGTIDISEKKEMNRYASASGKIYLNDKSIASIKNNTNPKGEVLENAKLAAISAVKKTPEMVFMCHPISINSIKVYFQVADDHVEIKVDVKARDRTGVEIECVAGVMNGLLAIFDLCKIFEKNKNGQYTTTKISDIKVLNKIKEEI